MRVFSSLAEFTESAGQVLGTSDWHQVTQQQIDDFAVATGDHQWIHVDAERAAAGPFRSTIAHGLLSLSLIPVLLQQIYRIEGLTMGVNYGLDRVRFPHPVPVDARIRETATLVSAESFGAGVRARVAVAVEIDGVEKPACAAEIILVLSDS